MFTRMLRRAEVLRPAGTASVEVILWDGSGSAGACASESFQLGALRSTALWTRSLDDLLSGHPAAGASTFQYPRDLKLLKCNGQGHTDVMESI